LGNSYNILGHLFLLDMTSSKTMNFDDGCVCQWHAINIYKKH